MVCFYSVSNFAICQCYGSYNYGTAELVMDTCHMIPIFILFKVYIYTNQISFLSFFDI